MGLMSFLRGSNGSAAAPLTAEPNLRPEVQERYRQLSPRDRRQLLHDAAEGATGSLSVDSTRDWQAERDAYIESELLGYHKLVRDAASRELSRPGGWWDS